MQSDNNLPVIAVMNDLEALISEIDDNPELSMWVVRLILKSIREKAQKMATESTIRPINIKEISDREAFMNSSSIHTAQVRRLRGANQF